MVFNGVFGHSYRNAEKEIEHLILHISETMLYETSMDTCICLQQKTLISKTSALCGSYSHITNKFRLKCFF